MKHTLKKLSDTQVELDVKLDSKDLSSVRQMTVAKLASQVKVPGFRAGKVPPKVAEKHLDKMAIESQLIEDAVNKYVVDVINIEEIQPLERPKVDIGEFEPGEKLEFVAKVEVLPQVELGDYKSLKVTKEKVAVTADEIKDVIERMRLGFAEKNEVDRAAKTGDEVWIDFSGNDEEGNPVPGATGKDYPLNLGSNTFIPGFEEGLVGKKTGDTFDLPLTFPEDYHHEPLKGKKVTFNVTVKTVKEVVLPEVDDEFAAKSGPFKTVAELKDDVKKEIAAQKERSVEDKLKDDLVEQAVKVSKVPVPEVLIEDQMNSIERDTMQNLMYRGMTLEQYLEEQGMTHDEWRKKELREAAERRVQVGLVLAELSKAEKIEVSKEELESRLAEMMSQYNDASMRSQLDTPDARRNLANRVLTEKTVDRLVELNSKKTATKPAADKKKD